MLALPSLQLPVVKLEFFALENVSVRSARLTRSGSDDSEESTGFELLFEDRVEFGCLFAFVEDSLDVVGLFGVGCGLGEFGSSGSGLSVLYNISDGSMMDRGRGRLT